MSSTIHTDKPTLRVVEGSPEKEVCVEERLEAWRAFTADVAAGLPLSCEWKLVALHLVRELGKSLELPLERSTTVDTPIHTPRLTLFRNSARLTQRELAERIGVEARDVRRWEHGKESVPDEHVLTLTELFGVSAAFLLGQPLD